MSSSKTSDGLRWRDDLPDEWREVSPWPPLSTGIDDVDVKLEELSDGAVIQENEPGRFVWAQDDRIVIAMVDAV
jgi:hypothetical protein